MGLEHHNEQLSDTRLTQSVGHVRVMFERDDAFVHQGFYFEEP